jgi:hypothetical protein
MALPGQARPFDFPKWGALPALGFFSKKQKKKLG